MAVLVKPQKSYWIPSPSRSNAQCATKMLNSKIYPVPLFVYADYEVECWAPAHFTSSHRVYTNEICRCKLEHGAGIYLPFDHKLPDPHELQARELSTIKNHRNNFKFLLPIECVVVICSWVIVHHFTRIFIAKSHGDQTESQSTLTSGFQFLCYCLVLLMTTLVWVALALVSLFSTGQTEDMAVMLCAYKVFQLN